MTRIRLQLPRLCSQTQRWLAWLCLCVLLAAQGVGQVHRISHGLPAALQAADEGRHPWGHGSGSLDCQVLDQLGHVAGPLSLPSIDGAPPSPALIAAPQVLPASLAARWARMARAPPSLLS